ncbi:DnaJ C-terminal domain-containing protein [uncultured Brevundimonas sp.]|uniref:DnaJ C-terminal domain-containing protein n=1 Tax=uncultured Brevundimonas sp. TaxID=213418 RepID=UPI0030EE6892|tara:strand:- start:292 stop:1023 length:732 start_codon:yes stop_codon:yes gene_type:complete
MRARSHTEVTSTREAYALLGLHGAVEAAALTRAFRQAVKAARPDQPGGDADRFRRIIAAWRLIQQDGAWRPALAAPTARPAARPVVGITPMQALNGGRVRVAVAERTLRVAVPPGLRSGEHLRLRQGAADGSDLYLSVLIRPTDGLSVLGDDLFMTWAVSPRVLEDGGRVEIDTHAGPRQAWVVAEMQTPVRLRLRNLGLPARGTRATGHLFVTLMPVADCPSSAEDLLARFTRVWTPDRLAA